MAFAARVGVLCIAAILAAAPAAARADSTAAFLARMRAAAGTPYRAHVRSVTRETDGGVASVTTTDAEGSAFLAQTCVQTLCSGTWFDGTTLYRVDFNGTALPDDHMLVAPTRALHDVTSLAFLDPAFRGAVRAAGTTTIDGRLCRKLLVTPRGGVTIAATVDARSALLVSVADERHPANALFYSDYRKVGPYLMPFAVGFASMVVHYDSRTLEPGSLQPPAGMRVQINGNAAMQTDPRRAMPIGPCTLDGVAAHCAIDTGTSGMSVSLRLAERLALPVVGGGSVRGLGDYATEVVRAQQLAIGNATFSAANYTVLSGIDDDGYDVVVGTDALAATRVLIDPAAHVVRFGVDVPSGDTLLPVTFSDFVPIVDARLGDLPARLLIDTGDESALDLSQAYYTAHPDAFVPTQERGVRGVGGAGMQLLGRTPYLALGDTVWRNLPVGATPSNDAAEDGRLGAGFLSRFALVLDYANERVALKELARPGVVSITP